MAFAEESARRNSLRCSWHDHLYVEIDVDFVADDNAAGVQGLVPGNSKILAVNSGGTGNGSTLQAPRILDGRLGGANLKNCLLGHAANGQVACDFEPAGSGGFDLGGLENHGRILGDVEEISAHKVLVSVRFASIDGRRVDGDVNGRLGNVGIVNDHRAIELMKFTANGGDHEMRDGKLSGTMLWIDLPRRGTGEGGKRQEARQAYGD